MLQEIFSVKMRIVQGNRAVVQFLFFRRRYLAFFSIVWTRSGCDHSRCTCGAIIHGSHALFSGIQIPVDQSLSNALQILDPDIRMSFVGGMEEGIYSLKGTCSFGRGVSSEDSSGLSAFVDARGQWLNPSSNQSFQLRKGIEKVGLENFVSQNFASRNGFLRLQGKGPLSAEYFYVDSRSLLPDLYRVCCSIRKISHLNRSLLYFPEISPKEIGKCEDNARDLLRHMVSLAFPQCTVAETSGDRGGIVIHVHYGDDVLYSFAVQSFFLMGSSSVGL